MTPIDGIKNYSKLAKIRQLEYPPFWVYT